MQLHRRLGLAKRRPGKERATRIDRRGIEGIDRFGDLDGHRFGEVKIAGDADQALRELEIDAPVAFFVGIGQRAFAHVAANAKVVELPRLRTQATFDIPQALAVGQLRKGHAQELIQATESANVEIAAVLHHQPPKRMPRREYHHLREDELAGVWLPLEEIGKACGRGQCAFKSLTP